MNMKKLVAAVLMAGMTSSMLVANLHADEMKKVYVTAIVEHPSLDATRDGIKDYLQEAGFVEGKNLKWQFQNAQGNNGTAAQIARKFVGDKPDVMVGISTPSAQTILAASKSLPLVFTAVTDPVAAQLVPSREASNTNVTGVSDEVPLQKQVELVKKILPKAKNIGIVYNPGEDNSVSVVKQLRKILEAEDMKLIEATAARTVDVGSAAKSLVGKVDAIYINTDNNAVAAFESIGKVANDNKIPLFASDSQSIDRGAFLTFSVKYFDIGRETGKLVAKILKGEKPGDLAYVVMDHFEIKVNQKTAKKQGVTIPEDVLKEATVVN